MAVQIAENVYWVGAIDWNVRNFHGYTYTTPRGSTYNAYLIVDEQVALVDTVQRGFEDEMMARIREIVDPARIRYLIANHGEVDHSGAIPYVLRHAPEAELICSRKGVESLGRYYPELKDFRTVVTGDTIALGTKTLTFLEAPMLHWPDSMFTYIPQDQLLLPNDAFGQHLASSQRFADELDQAQLWQEAAAYYANILTPFSKLVLRKLDEVAKLNLPIVTIAPSHGVIWRRDPGQILEAYRRWASAAAKERVVIVYETMWGSTGTLARALEQGIVDEGVEALVRSLPESDRTDIFEELLEAGGVLVGSSTHNQRMLPNVAAFLDEMVGLRFGSKLAAAFGCQGWTGGAVPQIEEELRAAGMQVQDAGLAVRWAPSEEELQKARAFGRAFARQVKQAASQPEQIGVPAS